MKKNALTLFRATLIFLIFTIPASAITQRGTLSIVGSSTVYPFATAVAERFSYLHSLRTPRIEATGSGGGFKLFCSGIGLTTPDIVASSRPITKSEIMLCRKNGVNDIVDLKIGYDGIVLVNSSAAPRVQFKLRDLYLALAESIPEREQGVALVQNYYTRWHQLDSRLPDIPIRVYGPPPTSGTRDAFLRLLLERGASQLPIFTDRELTVEEFRRLTNSLREDGRYINIGENDSAIIGRLERAPDSFALFGYSFFDQNRALLHAATLEGNTPCAETIQDGSYPGSRSLYLYIKKAHVGRVSGIRRYLKEFTSEQAWGPNGYLVRKGLVPLLAEERADYAERIEVLQTMSWMQP